MGNRARSVLCVVLACMVMLGLAGCSGPNSNPTPPLEADFSLSITPSSQSLAIDGSGVSVSLLATAVNGYTGSIAVAASGLPQGVTISPGTVTLTPGVAQKVTLLAGNAAVTGNTTVSFTGTSGTLSHMASLALVVGPAADFSLTVTPASQSVTIGGPSASVSLLATATNGFMGSITVAVNGLPAGVTANPTTIVLTPGTAQPVTLAATPGAAAGIATVSFAGSSGTLSHSTNLALTVAPAPPPTVTPDFSLSVSPSSQSLTIGSAGASVSLLATAANGFNGNVAIAVSGLPTGVTASPAIVTLTPGTAQSVTLVTGTTAAAGSATVTFIGTSGSLSHSANLALTVAAPVTPTGIDVVTYHYDNTRQGINDKETVLTTSNVNSNKFGLLGVYSADGLVDAQPLYVGGLTIGKASKTANVIYVATEHDSVYAFDAATGKQYWKSTVLGSGETTSDDHGCGQITPEIGITSTPVIDRSYGAHGAIFVVGMTKDANGGYHHRLHALDLTTGAELNGSPTEITATYPGTGQGSQNGTVIFAPGQYAERVGLLLLNGTIYMGWTSHCDLAPYTGWVMGYSEANLAQTKVLNLTPNGSEGSIWMSGYGLAADTSGNIYLADANGTWDNGFDGKGLPSSHDYGNALLKLSTSSGLAVSDFFEPYNTTTESDNDIDMGAGGAMLLPDLTDSTGATRHLLVGAGKDTNIYIANRDDMGNFNQANNSELYQELPNALANGAWSGPAYFNNTVYYAGQNDVLKAFSITNAKLNSTPASVSSTVFGYPGATPSVSANGTANGIVWAVESGSSSPAVLHAYDASNLSNELYNSTMAAKGRDAFGNGNKFITPVVTNGMVFVGTPNGVAVFGLLP